MQLKRFNTNQPKFLNEPELFAVQPPNPPILDMFTTRPPLPHDSISAIPYLLKKIRKE